MKSNYPILINAKLKPGEQNRFNVRFVKHSSIAGRLLELNGGTDALKNFCRIYVDQTKKFKSGLPSRPAIVIVDNDKAGRDVVSYAHGIAKNQGLPLISGHNYVFIRPNLYVVRIKSPANEPNCVIEELFPDQLLNTKLGSKVLTLSNQKVGDNEYGKMYFAKHVVPNADPKDFSGFTQLLDALVEVIADFASRVQVQPTVKKA